MKPARRPMRRISSEAGTVVRAVPMTKDETGRVAQPGDGAMSRPTSPEVTNIMVVAEP
jgi:hypothetical protein